MDAHFSADHAERDAIARISGLPWLIRFRRMLGLYAFFYGTLHLMTYVWLDKSFDRWRDAA